MLISLSEIMSVKGKVLHITVPIEMEYFKLDGAEYSFAKKNPIDLKISCEGERMISLECSTEISLMLPCSRCLEEVETKFDIHVSKNLDFHETEKDRIEELDETNYVIGYDLDTELLLYNEILIQFPLKVLCSEDCKGICFVCGTNLNKENCQCDKAVGDPRMSAFQDVFKNFKEV
ncbi:YceD family protein [Anaeromicropila populeti]|uniref:DUF177 domain-containing protein n=1 Tax=Anaeromicropila populeti TaxID=37658 RepID=A0A1I6KI19_9FIRM|nr:DUF177 domain-containing protein [Anaeromicropila populeti]SFR90846.1 uncharacterized protein SAMN05661086_02434 [Anaeromicropila populeti]